MSTYQAAYLAGPAQFEIRQVPVPEKLAPSYFLADVDYCAICGSDRGFWSAGTKQVALGHEMSVTVIDPGDTDFKKGDRLAMYPGIPCWQCESCKQGMDNICTQIYYKGYSGISADGGYAQKYTGPAAYAFKLPDHVSSQAGSLIEPVATSLHAVHRSNIKLGDKVLVIGAGPIGLYCAELAKLAGASLVVISEYNKNRLEVVRERSNLDGYFLAADPDLNAKLKEVGGSGGDGFDVIFECSASSAAYTTMMQVGKVGATAVFVGLSVKPTEFITQFFALREISIIPSMAYTIGEYKKALELISQGKITPEKYVTRIVSLDKLQSSFDELFKTPDCSDLKILVKPN